MWKNKTNYQKVAYILLLAGVLGMLGVVVIAFARVSAHERSVRLYVDNDDNIDSVLHKINLVSEKNSWLLKQLLYRSGYEKRVQNGSYLITPETRVWRLFRNLFIGNQQPINLQVREVRTISQLAAHLSHKLMLDSATVVRQLTDTHYCRKLGHTPQTVISLFLPNTYEVYWTTNFERLMERMKAESSAFWTQNRLSQAGALNLTPVEVMTIASIVDEETAYFPEKAIIARLYINRLRLGMPLQADPTVKFALQNFELRRIYHKHLNVESPYNTYRNVGLPPGPIRIPALSTIDAVLQAPEHNYLYMCAKEDFSGAHNFSETYADHLKNAARYAQALNQRQVQ